LDYPTDQGEIQYEYSITNNSTFANNFWLQSAVLVIAVMVLIALAAKLFGDEQLVLGVVRY
jgi:hypothetical protein